MLAPLRRLSACDDSPMHTLAAPRPRGVPPEAIPDFARSLGVPLASSIVDFAMLEHAIRECLNKTSQRRMAVLRPLKLIIENYPVSAVEELDAVNNPECAASGTRRIPFGRELYIEAEDSMEFQSRSFS